jgi:GNAT superfamily N-acetyltransferase
MGDSLNLKTFAGRELERQGYVSALARLRIEVFREYPYLYDGTPEYEEKYLRTYLDCTESLIVLVFDGDRVVGASTALPMDAEVEAFRRPFIAQGYDVGKVFYCGESVLLPAYRGRGIYPRFFQAREGHARSLGRFEWCSFCAVQRAPDHPRRPADYLPLDRVWERYGYTRHPELLTTFTWKDLDEPRESPKDMVYWLKPLTGAAQ